MKNRLTITESEREKILGLHEQAKVAASPVIPPVTDPKEEKPGLVNRIKGAAAAFKQPELVAQAQVAAATPPPVAAATPSPVAAATPAPVAAATPAPPVTAPVAAATPAPPVTAPVKSTVQQIQQILVDKYKKNIGSTKRYPNGVDSIWGPKTAAAVNDILSSTPAGGSAPAGGSTAPAGGSTTPAGGSTTPAGGSTNTNVTASLGTVTADNLNN
jgi:hypothetical protein